ncbi:MAG: efflux RND transporter periplasmic adaptor subunit [Phycisphaerales bacterium JB063]
MRVLRQVLLICVGALLVVALATGVAWRVWAVMSKETAGPDRGAQRAVPVETSTVERGSIELERVFSGTLVSAAEVQVAPKVGGRVLSVAVDLADPVEPGTVVVVLDSDEFEQAVAQAEAELAVAEANLSAARYALEIADREMQRQSTLLEQGVASDTQFDQVKADQLAATAAVAVAEAQVRRSEAAAQNARTRRDYTQVRAFWESPTQDAGGVAAASTTGDPAALTGRRFVSRRMVEEGDTVSANTPLITIVQLDPIKAVLYVSERDYAQLRAGQEVSMRADAYPGRTFVGEVTRVSPVFESNSRQARIELSVPNTELLLKPGMFIRATAVLDRAVDTLIVPEIAVVKRDDRPVVFVVDEAGGTVRMVPVELGIANNGRVQVTGEGLGGRVVTLGQQLLDNGSEILLREDETTPAADAGAAP